MKKILFLVYILITVFMTSCYEDIGNYVYDESIEDVKVTVERYYATRKEKQDFIIAPQIEVNGNKSDLRFLWLMNTDRDQNRGDTVSQDETLTISIDPEDPDFKYEYYIRYYVTDTKTGATAMYPIQLSIGKPYESSWMVMHTVDDHAEVGSVEYVGGATIVTPDAYTKENGESLTGRPITLGAMQKPPIYPSYWGFVAPSEFYIATTNPEESGLVNQSNHLKLFRNWQRMIHPAQFESFTPGDISMRGTSNECFIIASGGKVFRNSWTPIVYEMLPHASVTGDYYVSEACVGPHVGLAYDKIGHRFFLLDLQNSNWWNPVTPPAPEILNEMNPIPSDALNAADANDIGTDKDVIKIIGGYQYLKGVMADWQHNAFYAYALSNTSQKSYIYVFYAHAMTNPGKEGDPTPLPKVFTIDTPDGVNENTPMSASPSYSDILFYAVGNKVYKLDFGMANGVSSLIYEHPNSSAQIVDLKTAVEGYGGYGDAGGESGTYGHAYTRSLGVGINLPGGEGELVVLNLNTAAKLDADGKRPSIQTYQGFGPIKSIVFI